MRVRVGGSLARRQSALTAAQRYLQQRAKVTTDARTGSALITYDPDELDPAAMVSLLREAHEVFQAMAPPEVQQAVYGSTSGVAAQVQSRFGRANRSMLRATQGHLDLRALLPITLGGLALRQLVRQGLRVEDAPWYVLAYYAFDSFVKLHADNSRRVQT